jgi:4-hydroxyacetophenone monooxygenase
VRLAGRVAIVTGASSGFGRARGSWELSLRGGDGSEQHAHVRALISAVGMLNRPSVPDLPGLRDFAGRAG